MIRASAATVALLFSALHFGLAACTSTAPFLDESGSRVAGSIASLESLEIGGVRQRVIFRGVSTDLPVLIILHGGPGISETALFRYYVPELERRFLVVYWDQRGAGRSFSADIPAASMTIDQFVSDLSELVTHVKRRFVTEKVILLAHSWGTIPGLLYVERHPEDVAAYVGLAQIVSPRQGNEHTYGWARAEATRRQDEHALRALDDLGPPPYDYRGELELGEIAERLGGVFHARMSKGDLIINALRTDEASLVDLYYFGRGNAFSLRHLWSQMQAVDFAAHRRFEAPIVFALGRFDQHVPSTLAAAYFDTIVAPCKQLHWFESSAHNPPFEEPRAFAAFMRTRVAPLAEPASKSASSVDPRRSSPGCLFENAARSWKAVSVP